MNTKGNLIVSLPTERLSLAKNFSWSLSANIATAASQWGLLVILARLGSPTIVGQYALGLALVAPLSLLLDLSLRQVQVTDIRSEYPFSTYLQLRCITVLFTLVTVLIIAGLAGYGVSTSLVLVLVCIAKGVDSISDIIYGLLQKQEVMDIIGKSMIADAVMSLFSAALVLPLTGSLPLAIISMIIPSVTMLVFYEIPQCKAFESQINFRPKNIGLLKPLAFTALPMGIAAAVVSLSANLPRYILETVTNEATLGTFAVLSYPLVAGATVVGALSQSALPRLADYYSTSHFDHFLRLLKRLIVLSILLGLGAIVLAVIAGQWILNLVFGSQYGDLRSVFILLVIGMAFGFINWFLNAALSAVRAFRQMLFTQIVFLAVTLLVSVIWIPTFGLIGAAWAVTIGMVGQIPLKWFVVRKVIATSKQQPPSSMTTYEPGAIPASK